MKYEILQTQDGSPSLRDVESMHHSAGAYSETQYIYGKAIRQALDLDISEYSVLVVGLGLGYIELIAMGEYLNYKKNTTASLIPFRMLSFEYDRFLRESFLAWLGDQLKDDHPLLNVYQKIGEFINQEYDLASVKIALISAYNNREWICEPQFDENSIPKSKFHMILYDAFSSKSTPELWTEDFLINILKKISEESVIFSTYACTGSLKRALKACKYEVQIRPGFSGKRDSTLAIR